MVFNTKFPTISVETGLIYCKHNDVRFPLLYRVNVTTTPEHLIEAGLQEDDFFKPGINVYFDLGTIKNYVGDINITPVTHIRNCEMKDSIVIRHHNSLKSAHSYLQCHIDSNISKLDDLDTGIYTIEENVFTSIVIPTAASWPGPLVFYVTSVPHTYLEEETDWACIIGPDGTTLEPAEFGF